MPTPQQYKLPLKSRISFLYLERGKLEQKENSLFFKNSKGAVQLPVANIATIILGPGTSASHAAMRLICSSGCTVCWSYSGGLQLSATGSENNRSSRNLLKQAQASMSASKREAVAIRMYNFRFPDQPLPEAMTDLTGNSTSSIDKASDDKAHNSVDENPNRYSLAQLRGKEGLRVRSAYSNLAEEHGIVWSGRRYGEGQETTLINQTISLTNSCLYAIVEAALHQLGYSPALGFVHSGSMRSFVYDVADLFKLDVSLPAAFRAVSECPDTAAGKSRYLLREHLHEHKALQRLPTILDDLLYFPEDASEEEDDTIQLPDQSGEVIWDLNEYLNIGINHDSDPG